MSEEYFSSEYIASRKRYVAELRTMLAEGLPNPEASWGSVYVFSGPEITFEEMPHENGPYNQTKFRLETGFDLVRQITALRLKKNYDEVTVEDIRASGPSVYFDGYPDHNVYMHGVIKAKRLEKEFGFPDDKFILPPEGTLAGTAHTGEQIQRFPDAVLAGNAKFAVVSDLYHLPRMKRYLGSKYDQKKIPKDRVVFYYARPARLSVRAGLREAKNLHPYYKRGFLSAD